MHTHNSHSLDAVSFCKSRIKMRCNLFTRGNDVAYDYMEEKTSHDNTNEEEKKPYFPLKWLAITIIPGLLTANEIFIICENPRGKFAKNSQNVSTSIA